MQRCDPRTVLDYRTVLDSLAAGEFHDLPVPRDGSGPLRAAHLHTLMAMTPAADLSHRTEHVLYGRLVLEASIRRQVAQLGARINQWVPVIAAGRVDTTDAAAALQRTLAELTHRMQDAGGPRLGRGHRSAPHRGVGIRERAERRIRHGRAMCRRTNRC